MPESAMPLIAPPPFDGKFQPVMNRHSLRVMNIASPKEKNL